MTQKIRIALAGALALAAAPALGYQEAFTGASERGGASVVVRAGDYSDGYVLAPPAPPRRQPAPAVAGGYTESFLEPAADGGAVAVAAAEAVEDDGHRMPPAE